MSISLLLFLFDHFQFTLIHGPNIPGSHAVLFFTALDFTSITSHIHNWLLLSLWLHLFILSGAISPRYSSSIQGRYRPAELIFQCHIFLSFHTVYGVLKARILKWFVITFSRWTKFCQNFPKPLQMVTTAVKLKDACSLEEKL